MLSDALVTVVDVLDSAARVRVSASALPSEPARKRRDRQPTLADEGGTDALAELRAALRVRPDTQIMQWMCWPDLWLQLVADDGSALANVGLIYPGWLRFEPHGDLELLDREAIRRWLKRWAPAAEDRLPLPPQGTAGPA